MNMLESHAYKLIVDIYASALRIIEHLECISVEDFFSVSGIDAQDIVARRLTIIGEAAAALLKKYPEFCAENSHIPLREARGMRNILVHEYDGIDWQAVWDTAQNELPRLIKAIKPLLSQSNPVLKFQAFKHI